MRQRGSEGASSAACEARTHPAQHAVHGIPLAGAPGETGQLPDRTPGEVTADHGERFVQPGGEVKPPPVMAAEVPSGVWSTVTDQAPGKAPDAMPAKRPCADVAAYSSPLIESVDVVACRCRGSGAGKQCRRRGQDRDHPSMPAHDLPYVEPAGGRNAGASSVVKAFSLARSRETASPAACRCDSRASMRP